MLEVKNISAGYGNKTILRDLAVTFEKGTLTSVIGVNGCGKSTLLKTILGILPLSDGEIYIEGNRLRAMSRNEIAKKVAYLAQGKNTPDMTVEQMVLHGRFPYLSYPRRYQEADRKIAEEAMRAVGIDHLADQPLETLSGGMRQNAYIAMALAQDTAYILLDEPTAYLDIAHQLELMKLLKKLAHMGKCVITVMHDLPLAFSFSDKIAVMHSGTIAVCAAPSEICGTSIVRKVFGVDVQHLPDQRYFCSY